MFPVYQCLWRIHWSELDHYQLWSVYPPETLFPDLSIIISISDQYSRQRHCFHIWPRTLWVQQHHISISKLPTKRLIFHPLCKLASMVDIYKRLRWIYWSELEMKDIFSSSDQCTPKTLFLHLVKIIVGPTTSPFVWKSSHVKPLHEAGFLTHFNA